MKLLKISLISLFGGAFLFYYYRFDPSDKEELFLSCPSKTFFHLNCPGCGSQRMIHSLLHFEFGQAFSYNPLLFISLPLVAVLCFQFVSNAFFGTCYRIGLLYKNWFVYSLFGVFIVYMIVRNMPFWPFVS